jgi:hypothetical protein
MGMMTTALVVKNINESANSGGHGGDSGGFWLFIAIVVPFMALMTVTTFHVNIPLILTIAAIAIAAILAVSLIVFAALVISSVIMDWRNSRTQ